MSKKKMSRRKKCHILLAIVIILAILYAAGYTLFIQPAMNQEQIEYRENTAQYGQLRSVVTESGTVAFGITSQLYDLDVSTEDEDEDDDDEDEEEEYLKVEEVYAAVGQRIQEGDAIYRFTQDSVEDVRKALTYAQTQAQIALAQAQTEYDIGVLTASLNKEKTNLEASLAEQNYNNTIAKLSTQMAAKTLEIEQLLSDIYDMQLALVDDDYRERKADIEEAYEQAVEDLEDAQEDFVTNRVEAANTFYNARDSYESFFQQFDSSNEEIEKKIEEVYQLQEEIIYEQQLMQKDLLAASQAYDSAGVQNEIADSTYENSLTSYENNLINAQEELEEATQKLEEFEAFVGDGTVYASGSGLVTQVGYAEEDYLVSAGVLIAYATSDAMTITVDVSEEDVVTMQVGDEVEIVFNAYEDETYTGIISSITTTATSAGTATVSYPVVISIQGNTDKLFEGMTADVTFITESTGEVVYVSRKAIVEQNGRTYLYKQSGDSYELSQVTTGFSDGANVEIISGLESGETYYIASVTAGSSGTGTEEQDDNE